MPEREQPLSYFDELARRDRERLRLLEEARLRAQQANPNTTYGNLSREAQLAALYPPSSELPELSNSRGVERREPATPAQIKRVLDQAKEKPV